MSDKEILKIMNEMSTKYGKLDAIPTAILIKNCTLYQGDYYQNSKCIID